MIARLIISSSLQNRIDWIEKTLLESQIKNPHPDLLYFSSDSKLGVLEAKKIKDHFSLKPYSAKGRVVILEEASNLTDQAQNALLKTLEELPEEGIIIMGASSDAKFLPTVLSRCQIVILENSFIIASPEGRQQSFEDIEKLLSSTIEERFEYIEKLKDKEEFLKGLVNYFHQNLNLHPKGANVTFLKKLLQTEEWQKQNVAIRAILEYLMLVMPSKV